LCPLEILAANMLHGCCEICGRDGESDDDLIEAGERIDCRRASACFVCVGTHPPMFVVAHDDKA
jgi:hypothetical protein